MLVVDDDARLFLSDSNRVLHSHTERMGRDGSPVFDSAGSWEPRGVLRLPALSLGSHQGLVLQDDSQRCPIFLQFLDCVWQLIQQNKQATCMVTVMADD